MTTVELSKGPGLPAHVHERTYEALTVLEQALACDGLTAVIGEIWGEPAALDFTATKRLALRAERGGTQAWLLRGNAPPDLSAARERWRVASLASQTWGRPSWRVTLFRSRLRPPAEWIASHDGQRLVFEPGHAEAVPKTAQVSTPSRRSRPAA